MSAKSPTQLRPRHRIIVLHEDDAVRDAIVIAAKGWRVLRAGSVGELERMSQASPVEIVVTDGQAYDGSIMAVLAVATNRCALARVLLVPSSEPVTLKDVLGSTSDPVYLQSSDGCTVRDDGPRARDQLREMLHRLRLAPYAGTLPALCVAQLGLAGNPFASLARLLVRNPTSLRTVTHLASALGTEARTLLLWTRRLGFKRTEALAFRIRAQMAALLVVIGGYSWPEARETFGESDRSNFRRRLRQWFGLQVPDLEAQARTLVDRPMPRLRVVSQAEKDRGAQIYPSRQRFYPRGR